MAERGMLSASEVLRSFQKLERLGGRERVILELPRWRCFCCHDTGIVQQPHLIVENYGMADPEVVCTNCNVAVSKWGREPSDEELARLNVKRSEWRNGLEIRDTRAPREICAAIHEQSLNDWLNWVRNEARRRNL